MLDALFFPEGTVPCSCPEHGCTYPCCTNRRIAVELSTMKDDGDGGILCKGICYQLHPAARFWVPYEECADNYRDDTDKKNTAMGKTLEPIPVCVVEVTPSIGNSVHTVKRSPSESKIHEQHAKGFSHSTLVGSSYNKVSIAKNAQDITIGATTLHITSVKIWEFLDKVIAAHQKDGLATCDRKILKSMTSTDAKKLQDLLDWEEYPLRAAERIGNTRYTGRVKFKLSR